MLNFTYENKTKQLNKVKMLLLVLTSCLVPYVVGQCSFPRNMSGMAEGVFNGMDFVSGGKSATFSVNLDSQEAIFRSAANNKEFRYINYKDKDVFHMKPDGSCVISDIESHIKFPEVKPDNRTNLRFNNMPETVAVAYFEGSHQVKVIKNSKNVLVEEKEIFTTYQVRGDKCLPMIGNYFRYANDKYLGFYFKDVTGTITDSSKLNPDLTRCVKPA